MLCDVFTLKLILYNWCSLNQLPYLLVSTHSGKIRGHYLTSYKGNKYEAYQGIPYALPPIGERRFSSPVPVKKWSNELIAVKLRDACLHAQSNQAINDLEDCLYLNVYVPTKKKTNVKWPVIFYIYGDGFHGGGVVEGQESFVIDHDVIFASANYRSGPLGFLSTEDEVIPGNMGLKDQSMALRWIYNNIEHFGGDHKKITLVGGSSGGACAQYHYLSPWSKGLFHAGISLSGSAFIPSAVAERSREKTFALGQLVNCTDNDVKLLVKCLRNISGDLLIDAYNKMKVQQFNVSIFGPVPEKSNSDPFIDDYPSEILKKGQAYDVPWITGTVSEEGLVGTAGFLKGYRLRLLNELWNFLAPTLLNYLYTIPKEQYFNVAEKIRKHYLGEKPLDRENFYAYTKLIGDRLFSVGTVNAAKAQASVNKSPVYFYYYTYRAVDSISNSISNSNENLGVTHGDDVHLVLKDPRITPTKSPNDMAMQRRLIQIWTSVAYNGVPKIDVKWPRVTPENSTTTLDYLLLAGPNNLITESNVDFAHSKFWNSIGFDEK